LFCEKEQKTLNLSLMYKYFELGLNKNYRDINENEIED